MNWSMDYIKKEDIRYKRYRKILKYMTWSQVEKLLYIWHVYDIFYFKNMKKYFMKKIYDVFSVKKLLPKRLGHENIT